MHSQTTVSTIQNQANGTPSRRGWTRSKYLLQSWSHTCWTGSGNRFRRQLSGQRDSQPLKTRSSRLTSRTNRTIEGVRSATIESRKSTIKWARSGVKIHIPAHSIAGLSVLSRNNSRQSSDSYSSKRQVKNADVNTRIPACIPCIGSSFSCRKRAKQNNCSKSVLSLPNDFEAYRCWPNRYRCSTRSLSCSGPDSSLR